MTRVKELIHKVHAKSASLSESRELIALIRKKGWDVPIELREYRLRLAVKQDPGNLRKGDKLRLLLQEQGKAVPAGLTDGSPESGEYLGILDDFQGRDFVRELSAAMEKSVRAGGGMTLKEDNVTLVTMPKSGSVFLHQRLSKALDVTEKMTYICANSGFPYDQIVREKLKKISREKGRHVIAEHAAPSLVNLRLLKEFSGKAVIHIRDPRAALLSWVHHIDNNLKSEKDLDNVELEYPVDYRTRDFEAKLEWNIQNLFPLYVEWLDRWLVAVDTNIMGMEFLLTTQDELREDAVSVLERICRFYGVEDIDRDRFDVDVRVGRDHYRKGSPDEFLEVFSGEQIAFCNDFMPEKWFERFGWQRGDRGVHQSVPPLADHPPFLVLSAYE